MSVINQVLNQLERRGVYAAAGQTMVRTVPPVKRTNFVLPLLLALVAAISFAAWQWPPLHPAPAAAPMPHPASVPPAPAPVPEAESEPVQTAAGEGAMEAVLEEEAGAVSRLSFELNSVPLPQRELLTPAHRELLPPAHVAAPSAAMPRPQAQNAKPAPAPQPGHEELPMKRYSPAQLADAGFRKAAALMQQGRIADAIAGYEEALAMDAGHAAARQALVALLLEMKRGEDAERVLQEGLTNNPRDSAMAMLLARLKVERGELALAVATLERSLPHADGLPDYHAFLAALLQREERHKEAINHYQIALQRAPDNAVWQMGFGISLQAVQRNEDARAAYQRALDAQALRPELQKFVQQRLKGL